MADWALLIHEALVQAGFPVVGVGQRDGAWYVDLADTATDAQRTAARQLLAAWRADSSRLAWAEIRERRDRLLAACDAVMLRGVEWYQKAVWDKDTTRQAVLKAAAIQWMAYRQALRDITTTFATPEAVVWPTPPAGG